MKRGRTETTVFGIVVNQFSPFTDLFCSVKDNPDTPIDLSSHHRTVCLFGGGSVYQADIPAGPNRTDNYLRKGSVAVDQGHDGVRSPDLKGILLGDYVSCVLPYKTLFWDIFRSKKSEASSRSCFIATDSQLKGREVLSLRIFCKAR